MFELAGSKTTTRGVDPPYRFHPIIIDYTSPFMYLEVDYLTPQATETDQGESVLNTLMLYVLGLAIGQATSIAYLFFNDYAPWLLERIPLMGIAGLFLAIVCGSFWLLRKEGLWKWAGVLISPASIPLGQIIWVDLLTRGFSPATVDATHHWQPFIYPALFTAVTMYLVYYRPKKESGEQRS